MKVVKMSTEQYENICTPSTSMYSSNEFTGVEVGISVEGDEPVVFVDSFDPGQTGTPAERWYGYVQVLYRWPDDLERPDPRALKRLVESKKFLAAVEAAVEEELVCGLDRNRANWVCRWATQTPRLDKAVAMLADVETVQWNGVWPAEDWTGGADGLGISAETTDEELEALAESIYNEALADGYVVEGLYGLFEKYRDELRKQREDQ